MVSLQAAVLTLAAISGGGETVLLDFYSDSCIPCRQMEPAVDLLITKGYPVRKVDFDRNRELAAGYGIDRLPCFVMLVDGQMVDRVFGGTTFSRLEQMCKMAQGAAAPSQTSQPKPVAPSQTVSDFPPVPSWMRNPDGGRVSVDDLIAASVRLRIEDANGRSCGSGTIIDARDGEALILTCGHIFRDSNGKGLIEVDLFGPAPAERIPGHLLIWDDKRDIGLVAIRISGSVAVARIAPLGYVVQQGDRVINLGCDHGSRPTARFGQVTSLNRYMGPPNLQVSGLPVEGRSGGGLFTDDGSVIGVCNAADPSDDEGFYAALASIHEQLDEAKLQFVYRADEEPAAIEAPLVAVDPLPMSKQMPGPTNVGPESNRTLPNITEAAPHSASVSLTGDSSQLSAEERAALHEIRQRKLAGAEVICVIRSRSDPSARSEIIVLESVSSAFLEQLAVEARAADGPHLTSMQIPHPRAAGSPHTNSTTVRR